MPASAARSAAQDYRAAREKAAPVDLSAWTVMRLRGADTRSFLQGIATQDFEGPPLAGALPTLFLTEKGRPVALAWAQAAPDGLSAWSISDEGARETLGPHFERFRVMEDVEFDGPEGMPRLLGFVGPERNALLRHAAASIPGAVLLESDPISFLLAPVGAAAAPVGVAAGPLSFMDPSAFEAWRLAVGLPRTGIDLNPERIATELSYPDAISMTKGCYVGQEIVSRTSNRGQVRRQRVGFRFDWSGEPIPARTEIRAGGAVAGYVTSSAPEPETTEGLGMGFLSTDPLQLGLEVIAVDGVKSTHLRVAPWPL